MSKDIGPHVEPEPGSVKPQRDGEHEPCPACGADMNGGLIWEHFFNGDEAEADRIAALYGATRTKGQWGRAVAIYSQERDRTVAYRCPDCSHEWGA